MRFSRPRRLSVAQQFNLLRLSGICHGSGGIRREMLTWVFQTRPTPISREYELRVVYRSPKSPEVFVDNPDLTILAGGRRIPHVFQQKPTRLCVCYPGEWTSSMQIATTIVPWSILWLYFFEVWLVTDKWEGGGRHPESES